MYFTSYYIRERLEPLIIGQLHLLHIMIGMIKCNYRSGGV